MDIYFVNFLGNFSQNTFTGVKTTFKNNEKSETQDMNLLYLTNLS